MISKNVIGIYARGGLFAGGGGLFAGGGGLFAGGPFAAGLIAGGLFASGLNAATRRGWRLTKWLMSQNAVRAHRLTV